jgi:hypothetical protein
VEAEDVVQPASFNHSHQPFLLGTVADDINLNIQGAELGSDSGRGLDEERDVFRLCQAGETQESNR